jgi:cytochrome P450
MGAPTHRKAPSPPALPLIGHLSAFRKDVLGLMLRGQETCGDVVRYKLGPFDILQLNHPDHIEQVLKDIRLYDKNTFTSRMIAVVTGQSLLTVDGEAWHSRRRLMQPIFSYTNLLAFTGTIGKAVNQTLQQWESRQTSNPVDLSSEMMRLTYRIVERALFGAQAEGDLEAIETAMTEVNIHTYERIEKGVNLPLWIPTPANQRYRNALATLDTRVMQILEQPPTDANQGHDILSQLAAARDEHSHVSLSPRELRDEAVTLLVAGHETTANAMSWTWHLISQHPEIEERLQDEVDTVLSGGQPSVDELKRLVYTTKVVKEALRLYPPIWAIMRRATQAGQLGGFNISANSRLIISPYVVHRNPALWKAPEVFDPDRFDKERFDVIPHHAYLPFGGGPRTCIGQNFAMMESVIIVAMLARSYRFEACRNEVVPHAGIALRIKGGLPMRLHKRA